MEGPFDARTAKARARAILDGPGMTVFSQRIRQDLMEQNMASQDAVNVIVGGKIAATVMTKHGWQYRASTRRMSVDFSFRGHAEASRLDELILESARRIDK